MNIFILVLVAVGCCAQEGQLVVSSGSSDRDVQPSCEGICAAPVEDFEPTKEWQTIRENQAIPPVSWIFKKYAWCYAIRDYMCG